MQSKSTSALLQQGTRFLESSRIPESRLEAEVLLAHLLGCRRIDLYAHPEQPVQEPQADAYQNLLEQRAQGVPTAYLRGEKEFFSLTFSVGPGVLIPRAETELLVEKGLSCLKGNPSPVLLELGIGSGAILISLLVHLPEARGIGADISPQALEYAKKNAQKHRVADRIALRQGNLFSVLETGERFDLILSNPPYIPSADIPKEVRFEPKEAFDGGADGLDVTRKILGEGWKFLKPGGYLLLETGNRQERVLLLQKQ